MNLLVQDYIKEINESENINLEEIIKQFERNLIKCFKLYKTNTGYEDYKMNQMDIIILYIIWKKLNKPGNINNYLLIIYSFYKLEEFYFPMSKFGANLDCFDIINDCEFNTLLFNFLKI